MTTPDAPAPAPAGPGGPRRAAQADARRAADGPRRRRPRWLLFIGVAMIVAGLVLVGSYVREAYLDPVVDEVATTQEVTKLEQEWSVGRAPEVSLAVPDKAVALLRVPAFGPDYVVPVVTGTSEYSLARGVGWFEGSAAPGQVGNFAVAGHRGKSGPFVRLLELSPGAKVEIETRTATYVYELTNRPADLTVDKHELWVLDPVPGKSVAASEPLLTLVTCRNFFHSPERSIGFGKLVETRPKG